MRVDRLHRELLRWFQKNRRDFPWRRSSDPYAVFVSEVMLQQTTVATVIPRYKEWLRRFPNLRALARANEGQVLNAWQGLGYYSRGRNLHRCAQICANRFGGRLPDDVAVLHSFPGVGRYTANAVATFAFDQSLPVVEANTARVLARLFNIRDSIDSSIGRKKLWEASARLVPRSGGRDFHSALMDLGSLVCVGRQPRCHICPIRKFCAAPDPRSLPIKRKRPAVVSLAESHDLINQRGTVLLKQCRTRWRGMWMLPPAIPRRGIDPVYTQRFSFTHHQILLQVFRAKKRRRRANERWFPFSRLKEIPIPSPHRRAISSIMPDAVVEKL